MVVVAGVAGPVVVPVAAYKSDVAIVEQAGAASSGTEDVAIAVVPVIGPTIDCSLSHFRIRFE